MTMSMKLPIIPVMFLLIISAVLLLVFVAQNVSITSHAILRHGTDAIYARECHDGWELRMYNPETQRTGLICMTSAGKFGIVILDRFGNEITAFLRNKNKTLEQVIRYMQRRGYELLQ